MQFDNALRRLILVSALLAVFIPAALADDPVPPPPKATGNVWSIAMLPDSQGYNQTYDMGGAFKGRGFQYKDRWPKQIEWIVKNREQFNIRFASSVGDHVQNFGFDPAKVTEQAMSPDAKRRSWMGGVDAFATLVGELSLPARSTDVSR